MSLQGLKVVVELRIRAITCPGVRFAAKDDVYLSVCLLNQYRKSACLPAVFPLLFRMRMRFEKTFTYAIDPATVAELLECEAIRIELIQLTPPAGEILANYEEGARSFLFPDPKLVPSFSGVDREVLMTRHPNFAGISPRLEFSTKTVISECSDRDPFHNILVKVMTRKRVKKPRQQSHFITQRQGSSKLEAAMPRARSLSPFRKSRSSSSSSETVQRHSLGSWSGVRRSTSSYSCSPESNRRNRSLSPHRSTFMEESRNLIRSYSNHLVPNESSSSDTDELLDCAEELGHHPSLSKYQRSPSPLASTKQNSSLLYSQNVWEEIQERVSNLLTSPAAMHRLAYGATESEIDEVLTRRSINSPS